MMKGIQDDIERYGRTVMCIFGEEDSPGFAYTIGNGLVGVPDLLLVGTNKGGMLNDLSELMIERGGAFKNGEIVSLGGIVPVKVITVTDNRARKDYTIQAGEFYGHQSYGLQQVLIPDQSGCFPGDPACARPFAAIPVFGRAGQLQ
jgi:hypothetical protein